MSLERIEITKQIPFFGDGDSLETRLRNVSLRGFPEVRIYEDAQIELVHLTPQDIPKKLHTPQLRVYRDHLNRIVQIRNLFLREGIDIFDLNAAYDFVATDKTKEGTEWTMIPPVVERFQIPRTKENRLDYNPLIGPELQKKLSERKLGLNPEVLQLEHTGNENNYFDLINDGSHRIHAGFENEGIKIIRLSCMAPGFPYYAAPQKYQTTVFQTRDERLKEPETKIHVVDTPGHKDLYRVFPSGGIMTGNVRPDKKLTD